MHIFRENPQSDITHYVRRTWISTGNIHISLPIWVKFGTDNVHVMQCNSYEFRENRYSERGAMSINREQSCEHPVACLIHTYILLLITLQFTDHLIFS